VILSTQTEIGQTTLIVAVLVVNLSTCVGYDILKCLFAEVFPNFLKFVVKLVKVWQVNGTDVT